MQTLRHEVKRSTFIWGFGVPRAYERWIEAPAAKGEKRSIVLRFERGQVRADLRRLGSPPGQVTVRYENLEHKPFRDWLAEVFQASRERRCGEYFELRQLNKDVYEIVPFPKQRTEPAQALIEQESAFRDELWERLVQAGGPDGVTPDSLRELGIYGAAQGIWVDKRRTGHLTPDGGGVTVSLLHTGAMYADDLSEHELLYHYPETRRPEGRDRSEVEATKAAARLGMQLFVITHSRSGPNLRSVRRGWVGGWDDESRVFYVTFDESRPATLSVSAEEQDDMPFPPTETGTDGTATVTIRRGQQRFKLEVFQRYGRKCAVCDLAIREVVEAAHFRPRKYDGSYDPRNGLPLCATHHRAFDAGLFRINPDTLEICYGESGPDSRSLRITRASLNHLPRKPHRQALNWHWRHHRRRRAAPASGTAQ